MKNSLHIRDARDSGISCFLRSLKSLRNTTVATLWDVGIHDNDTVMCTEG